VPTDELGPLLTEEAPPKSSPIENELPTYRAISNHAVSSVICGVLASFSFASLMFLVFAALAIVLGVVAIRAINRRPDILTGRRLANVGIAMGVIFGLTVITYSGIQDFILRQSASKFAREYAAVLKEGIWGKYLLYRDVPEYRKQSPEEKEKEYEKTRSKDRFMMDTKMAPLKGIQKALEPADVQIHFVDIESHGVDESMVGAVYYFATALFEIDGPGTKGTPQYAMALLKGKAKGRHVEWWVEDTMFPYKLKSFQGQVKPIDDGHGHAPGAH
jgi:Domain of unknown function (DUF4190)